eukprot:766328-Hanusia_phi.AAC.14
MADLERWLQGRRRVREEEEAGRIGWYSSKTSVDLYLAHTPGGLFGSPLQLLLVQHYTWIILFNVTCILVILCAMLQSRLHRHQFHDCYSTLKPPRCKNYKPGPPMSTIRSFGAKSCEQEEPSSLHGKTLKGLSAGGKDKKSQKPPYSKAGVMGTKGDNTKRK